MSNQGNFDDQLSFAALELRGLELTISSADRDILLLVGALRKSRS
jgi:hypothetical protein